MKGLIGKKLGMTQIFGEGDRLIPVTVIEAGPCVVTQVKSVETDGYNAVQIGFGEAKDKHVDKPSSGHFKKSGVSPRRHLTEIRVDNADEYVVGQEFKADTFAEGDRTDAVGISKGKGFAGGMKRWGFSGGPAGHGSHFHRRTGSVGMAATPGRVIKGKKGPGQYGNARCAISNLRVVKVDPEQNIIMVRGAVPGARGSIILLREAKKSVGKKQ
jgi:large subunit ribosomal protein L3